MNIFKYYLKPSQISISLAFLNVFYVTSYISLFKSTCKLKLV